jgi:hypothetical protein
MELADLKSQLRAVVALRAITTVSHRVVGMEKKEPFLQHRGRTFPLLPVGPSAAIRILGQKATKPGLQP